MKKDLLLLAALVLGVATTAHAAKNKTGERIDTLKARQLQEVPGRTHQNAFVSKSFDR